MSAIITALESVFAMFFAPAGTGSAGGIFVQAFNFLTSEDVVPYVLLVVGVSLVSFAFGRIRSLVRTA